MKKIISLVIVLSLVLSLCGCSKSEATGAPSGAGNAAKNITIAYQGGIGYAPVHILEAKKFIEANYDGEVNVSFVKLDSGAAINEGIIGGTISIGCMGIAPAISGVIAGIPYKAISNLCSQSHGLMTGNPEIKSLSDITDTDKIALVNFGSIQHIFLAMAAEKELGDAHALDNNVQAMSHAEGMAALESGTVALHLTSAPFIYQERSNSKYSELSVINEVWPAGNSFLIAMAANSLYEDTKLYEAVSKAFIQAIEFINANPEETAQIETGYLGLDLDTVKSYLDEDDCRFFPEMKGVGDMAAFMFRAGFTESELNMSEFSFPNVAGN